MKQLSQLYCSSSCFDLDHILYDETPTVCNNCGDIFNNTFNENECQKCLRRVRIDLDADYNKKRTKLQKNILKLLDESKITKEQIKKKVEFYMATELLKNSFMEKNNLNFYDWLKNMDEGANKCFLMYDNCIIKILEEFGIPDIPPNSFYV